LRLTRLAAFRLLTAGVILLSAAGAIVGPNPLTTSATPSRAFPRSLAHTDVNPLGAAVFLDREVEPWKKEQTLKMARAAGLGWIKVMFSWEEIEPQRGIHFDERYRRSTWEKFDGIVALAQKYGLRVIARLDRTPTWARSSDVNTAPPDDPRDFGRFVADVVSRYRGRVQHYQIWNEPNLAAEWGGRAVEPERYARLLQAARQASREVDPNALLLSAPLAQTLDDSGYNRSDLSYLDLLYRAGARADFDILFANAYGFDRPPTDPPAPDRLNFARVTLLRELMVRHGDAEKAVWLNEVGWNAAPSSFPRDKLIWERVSDQQQAEYTRQGIEIARSWDWMGAINVWYFRQVGDIPATDPTYYFRMVDVDFTPRAVYYAVQDLARRLTIAEPGIHQESSPAVARHGQWISVTDGRASGGGYFTADRSSDSLVLTFRGSEVDLIATRGPRAGRLLARLDGQSIADLPHDAEGRSFLDLSAEEESWQKRVPVAAGLDGGTHRLELTVVEGSGFVAVDGYRVAFSGSPGWRFYGQVGLGAFALAALVVSFISRRRARG
jgi:hypothetical protein